MDVYQWLQMTMVVDGETLTSNLHLVTEHLLKGYTTASIRELTPFSGRSLLRRMV